MGQNLARYQQSMLEAIYECTTPNKPPVIFDSKSMGWYIESTEQTQSMTYYDQIRNRIQTEPGKNPFSRRKIGRITLPTWEGSLTLTT